MGEDLVKANADTAAPGAYEWLLNSPVLSRWERFKGMARDQFRSHWRVAAALLLLAVPLVYVGFGAFRTKTETVEASKKIVSRKAPRIESPFAPAALRPLSEDEAAKVNAAAPVSTGPNPAAAAFLVPLANATDYQRSVQCMTMAIYYEAANEPDDSQRAVAQVVLNRVRHPAYPRTVCGVIFEGSTRKTGCQFSFACDGSMSRVPSATGWRRAEMVAVASLAGYVFEPVGLATHYHANYVVPYWAASLDKVASYGAHIFYRWRGNWGRSAAFAGRYVGAEPQLPFLTPGVEEAAAEKSGSGEPVDVAQRERPVIAVDTAPTTGGKSAPEKKAVAIEDRWIVPRGGAMPVEALRNEESAKTAKQAP